VVKVADPKIRWPTPNNWNEGEGDEEEEEEEKSVVVWYGFPNVWMSLVAPGELCCQRVPIKYE